jgi:predicted short-subunit dehydrogenase-like oxidoreductase (DUF2520 family)
LREHQAPDLTYAIVGAGRLGNAISQALITRGASVIGPLGRGANPCEADVVLLCVPDSQIAAAARCVSPGPLVGHCSGVTGLDVLDPHEAFAIHPLMSFPTGTDGRFKGTGCAISSNSEPGLTAAYELAALLEMEPYIVSDDDRAIYHAGASFASNFVVTLAATAERMMATANVDRKVLTPLMHATIDYWCTLGPERAITGPIARGDEETIQRQREAVIERAPELSDLFDALVASTRELVSSPIQEKQ